MNKNLDFFIKKTMFIIIFVIEILLIYLVIKNYLTNDLIKPY